MKVMLKALCAGLNVIFIPLIVPGFINTFYILLTTRYVGVVGVLVDTTVCSLCQ